MRNLTQAIDIRIAELSEQKANGEEVLAKLLATRKTLRPQTRRTGVFDSQSVSMDTSLAERIDAQIPPLRKQIGVTHLEILHLKRLRTSLCLLAGEYERRMRLFKTDSQMYATLNFQIRLIKGNLDAGYIAPQAVADIRKVKQRYLLPLD